MLKQLFALFIVLLLPYMAHGAVCPDGYSESFVGDDEIIVPIGEECPDGTAQLYTVSDCTQSGTVCAICDSGYTIGNGKQCVQLCNDDVSQLRFGDNIAFNLLKKPGTVPALNVLTKENQVCYVDLVTGTGRGVNFELSDGSRYHAVDNTGGYRVCASGYELSYSCGDAGGVPPEKQKLLKGQWYTVPPNAASCRVPSNMRFSGWYMDGKKQTPYTIYTYDFDVNKTLTAMFRDIGEGNHVNYYCGIDNQFPEYTDIVAIGESVAPKTNMCPYEPKEVEPFAWIEPFSQDDIEQLRTLNDSSDLSEFLEFGIFRPYLGMGASAFASEIEIFVLALLLSSYTDCINDSEYALENPESCALATLFLDHTYFDPVVLEGVDVSDASPEALAVLFKDIVPEEDVSLHPLYMPTLYEMTWNCGQNFRVHGGLDFDGTTRYGWRVNYACVVPGSGGYGSAYGKTFVGWDVDGVLYEGRYITYTWTEDKTATGVFDYNLNAGFDCGTDGTLTSGDATLTYNGRGLADMYVPLNISAQCTANPGRKFVGWQIDGQDTIYNVGDTLNWVDSIVAANSNCDAYYYDNYCDELNFTAVYEEIVMDEIHYYCSTEDTTPRYIDKVQPEIDMAARAEICEYDGVDQVGWIKIPSASRIEAVREICGNNNDAEMATIVNLLDLLTKTNWESSSMPSDVLFARKMSESVSADKQECVTAFNDLVKQHVFFTTDEFMNPDWRKFIADVVYDNKNDINGYVYPIFVNKIYHVDFDCGDNGYYTNDWQMVSANYGQEYSFSGWCNAPDYYNLCSHAGWAIDSDIYKTNDKFVWSYDNDKTAHGLYTCNLYTTFDCGTDGVLTSGTADVVYQKTNVDMNHQLMYTIDAQCTPNAGKKFMGWELNDTIYNPGDALDWLDVVSDSAGFVAVYTDADVVSINYYCDVDDIEPSQVDKLSVEMETTVAANMCEYDTNKYVFAGWYTPFTDEEVVELQNKPGYADLSITGLVDVFINKSSNKIITDISVYNSLLDLMQTGQSSGNDALDYLARLVNQHVLTGNVTVFENMNLYALYIPQQYTLTWNCGNISHAGDNTQNKAVYYGNEYDVTARCLFWGDSTSASGGVAEFSGWKIGENVYRYGDKFVWDYTENITAVGLYDYNLTATFDCGNNGILSSGDATITESGSNISSISIPSMNITASCTPNIGKKFVGWTLPYYLDMTFPVGATLSWKDIIVERDNARIESAADNFVAVYEDILDVAYYCSGYGTAPTYREQYSGSPVNVTLRRAGCNYDTGKYELFGWYTPFTDEEVAKLKSYSFNTKYADVWAEIKPIFIDQTSNFLADRDVFFTVVALYMGYSSTDNDAGLKYLAQLLQKHWYVLSQTSTISVTDNIGLYPFYTGKLYMVYFDCGKGSYSFWEDWNTGYYGAIQKWCDSCNIGDYASSGWSFAGWEVDGVFHERCEPFVWKWTENQTAIGIYDYDMTASFDCGTDGTLVAGDATVQNVSRGNASDAIPLNITAECAPNAGKRFVGWSNNGNTYTVGQTLNWLDYAGNATVDFTAVYEDVIDINYYCDATNSQPTFIDRYAIDTTSVPLRESGCEYDTQRYIFMGWFTPFTDEEVAKLKSYSFNTKHADLWAVLKPTFIDHTSGYAQDYDSVFILAGLYSGRGTSTNDAGVKYLTTLLQEHWFVDKTSMAVSENTDLYAFYVNYL